MKKARHSFMSIALLLLMAACLPLSVPDSGRSTLTPLPTPPIGITSVPHAAAAMEAFLALFQKDDFVAMYAMLSKEAAAKISADEFSARYANAIENLSASTLDFQLIGEALGPRVAQVAFRVTYHTVLFGDLQRDMNATLVLEDGQWRLQWDDGLILPELAGGNTLKTNYEIPTRGDIYDRSGIPIVTQSDAYALGVTPVELTGKSEAALAAQLALVCHKTPEQIQSMYSNAAPDSYVAICDASAEEVKSVLNLNARGLTVTPFSARYYLNQGIAPQAVGYASLIQKEDFAAYRRLGYRGDEIVGQMGIEKSMEQYLAGRHGGTLYVVDPNGQILNTLAQSSPQPADSVYLTIDSNLQEQVQKTIQSFHGAAVVIERDTGQVLAMASSPGYDQNLFDANNFNRGYLLGQLQSDPGTPLVNRAAQSVYPLGSAFKPITMAAALESGLYEPHRTYDCTYDFTELADAFGGPVLHDWTWEHCQNRLQTGRQCDTTDSTPSGLLTLQEGLMRSCNPYFWHIGLDLYNTDRAGDIAEMARAFGLGSATGIGVIAEATGNVSPPQQPIDATNQAIGQGTLGVTPLQVARFVAAVGNGGTLYRPQLIQKVQPVNGDASITFKPEAVGSLPLRPDNLLAIQQAMQMVVKDPRGTAYLRMLGLNLPFAGKTGTAQSGGAEPHAWFIGYTDDAANSGKPDIAVAVVLEYQGEGSDWAAPVFRGIVESYYYGSPQTTPAFGPFDHPYTPTPLGGVPTKKPRGKQPTPTP